MTSFDTELDSSRLVVVDVDGKDVAYKGPQIAAFGFNKRHIPGYIRVAHAAVAFGYNFRI